MVTTRERPQKALQRAYPSLVAAVLLFAALSAYLYWKALVWWWYEWTAEGSYYAHGVFIPFFVAAMLWRDRERLRRLPASRSWWGLVPIAIAILLVVFAYRADVTVTLSISFMLFLVGAAYVVAGRQIARAVLFPLLFLLTMIPIFPNQVINQAAFPIQLTSAKIAAEATSLMGFTTQRMGTQIKIDDYTLNVEVPCSGFKTLVGMMAFAGAFAYLVDAAAWKRWFLFLSSIPLAIVVNGVRITLIGVVGALFGDRAAATFHDWSGFLVLIVGFAILFGMARWLKCERFMNMPLLDEEGPNAPAPISPEEMDRRYGPPRADTLPRLSTGLYSVAGVLLLACVLRYNTRPVVAHYPLLEAKEVPATLPGGAWSRLGTDGPLSPEVQAVLQPETYLDRNYAATPPKAGVINLFITGGKSRRTFHDPHECFVGSGYIMHDVGVTKIDTSAGPVAVQETVAENGQDGTKALLMYVYMVDGKQQQSMASVHGKIIWQSLFGGAERPFYFVRFRQMANGTGTDRREELIDFIKTLWPTIAGKVQHVN